MIDYQKIFVKVRTEKNNNIHKTMFKISDDQTNIEKYSLAANITECHIISKLISLSSIGQF